LIVSSRFAGARRTDLDDEVRRALDVLRAQHLGAPSGRHVEQIRLDDVEPREDDVERRQEHLALRMLLQEFPMMR
jgi:hypothetical protein